MKRTLLLCAALAGCTVGPDYKPPQMPAPLPSAFNAPAQADAPLSMPVAQSVDLSAWWRQFHDAELESLITRALAQNLDLLTAQSRVREAREQEVVAGAAGLPSATLRGNTIQAHSGNNPLAALSGGQGGSQSSGSSNIHMYAADFDASWEIDVFGGVRRSVEAAAAGTDAARWQVRDGEVSLTAEIAADYVQLRADQARLQILTEQEKSQRDVLALTSARARAGFVTALDVNQQQQLVAQTTAQRPALLADILIQRHAIAMLMGQAPGALDAELNTTAQLPPLPPQLPIGMPADLLRMRPDIRMAERQLARANAEIGVATADLYPKFNLMAAISSAATGIGGLFNSSSLSEIGIGGITWPVFQGGRLHATIHAREEEEKQAYYAWQKAVLGGIQNAEDALVRYETEQQRFVTLNDAAKTARQSTALALQQYRTGLVTYINVLQAQSTQFTAEDNLAQSRAALSANLVAVYKALGGGWRNDGPQTPDTDSHLLEQ